MNLIMMKVGSSGSQDVAGGTAGDSPNISSGGSAEDYPATLSAGQDDVEAVACRSHHREMSDGHVWPVAEETLVNLTLEENMQLLHQANMCDFLLKAGANKSTIEKAKESAGRNCVTASTSGTCRMSRGWTVSLGLPVNRS